ncbi:unnamed protein product [Gulo gulo]|uniref:Uncharacterized protein n=1 Tax=Gulo gulo TaxID=48420 RepID=A0A9X9Q2K2_GULGU|nr:unnamed protein product [Gulo gulo]
MSTPPGPCLWVLFMPSLPWAPESSAGWSSGSWKQEVLRASRSPLTIMSNLLCGSSSPQSRHNGWWNHPDPEILVQRRRTRGDSGI